MILANGGSEKENGSPAADFAALLKESSRAGAGAGAAIRAWLRREHAAEAAGLGGVFLGFGGRGD
jgi:hypothetical protein